MIYKLLLWLTLVHNISRFYVDGVPLTKGIFKGILNEPSSSESVDDSLVVELETNELAEQYQSNFIDLSAYGRSIYGVPDFNETGNLVALFKANETSINPEELGSYVEGDILMPQHLLLFKNGLSTKSSRWPNGEVPFEIVGDFTPDELDVIAYAIDEYHEKTCIRFIPHTDESDYISIARGNSGCWSSIGRVGGKQIVNLQAPGCLTKLGTAMHELMHALGFLHEQNRKERDSYVDIQLQNVQRRAVANFKKMSDTEAFGVGYDYGSVMHYSPNAFSSNGQPTILAKQPEGRFVMGQRDGFSAMDLEKINRMYNCKANQKPIEPPIELSVPVSSRFPFAYGFANNRLGEFIGNFFNRFG